MKTFLTVVGLSALLSTAAFAADMTGFISDDSCATKSASSAKAADWINPNAFEACAKKCLKEGSSAVFVTEDNKIVRLSASATPKVMPFLGHRVKLTGSVKDGLLTVDRIATIKMEPRAGATSTADDHQHSDR
jgi:hypothetical protein